MRAHVIEGGVVVNTIEVNDLGFLPNLIPADKGSIGWLWDGENLTDPNAPSEAELTEERWVTIRAERNAKLAASDWTQLPDSPISNVATQAWATYRQALRDITEQSDPFSITWPEEPR